MRHLVTGGLGFIGQHLVDLLLAEGEDVLIVDDHRSQGAWRDDVEVAVVDIGYWWSDEPFAGIWHLASPVGPVGVMSEAGRITGEVFRGASNCLNMALECGVPLIHVSTSEVYGGGESGLCAEDMECRVSPNMSARLEYQTAKLAVEVMMRNTAGLDARIIRPFNVAGPGQRPGGGFVLPRWAEQGRTGQPLTVYAPGSQRRAMTHVHDIVEGMWAVYRHGNAGLWNLGNPNNRISMTDLADLFVDVHGGRWELVDPQELHGPAFVEAAEKFPDASKAIDLLEWTPHRTLRQIVEDAVL